MGERRGGSGGSRPGELVFPWLCPALPSCAHHGVPEIVQTPLALNLSSYSAFHTGPHLPNVAHPLPSASPAGPRQGTAGVGPSSLPSQPHSCCHGSPPCWGQMEGAEKPAPSLAGVWDPASSPWLPAWLRLSRLLGKHWMSKACHSAPVPSLLKLQRGSGPEEGRGCLPHLGSQRKAWEGHPGSTPQHFIHSR